MAERAPATVIIYEVPAAIVDDYGEQISTAQRVAERLAAIGFRFNGYDPPGAAQLDEQLPAVYEDDEANGMIAFVGAGSDLDELVEWGVTFSVHQSAHYEWDGRLAIHVPELGIYSTACNQDGGACIDATEVDDIVSTFLSGDAVTREQMISRLDALTGRAWRDALVDIEATHTAKQEVTQ